MNGTDAPKDVYASTADVQARYGIRRPETARRFMDSTGESFLVANRLVVPVAVLDEYDQRAREERHQGGYQPGAWRRSVRS